MTIDIYPYIAVRDHTTHQYESRGVTLSVMAGYNLVSVEVLDHGYVHGIEYLPYQDRTYNILVF